MEEAEVGCGHEEEEEEVDDEEGDYDARPRRRAIEEVIDWGFESARYSRRKFYTYRRALLRRRMSHTLRRRLRRWE
jgi:hypothetical protein